MTEINETRLPGVGIRFDFELHDGGRIVIVNHHSGRVEILLCSEDDPDACHEILRLTKDDAKALAEVLGQSRVTEEVTRMQLSVEGLTIDWVNVGHVSACAGCTVHEIEHKDEEAAVHRRRQPRGHDDRRAAVHVRPRAGRRRRRRRHPGGCRGVVSPAADGLAAWRAPSPSPRAEQCS